MDKIKSSEVPSKPGIYIFKDKDGSALYVGKAKNLRKRVVTYFNQNSSWKVKRLTNEAKELSFLVSQSESDALLAEYSFIQEHKPKYNIQFKDDKSYPYISLTNHQWPRAVVTRVINDKYINFGPFPFVGAARRSLDHLINIYPVRTCSETVFKRHIKLNKPCLLFDIGKCSGPCVDNIADKEYRDYIDQIRRFYKGYSEDIINQKLSLMKNQSNSEDFEEAGKTRDLIKHLESARETQVLMTTKNDSADVIGIDIGKYDVLASCLNVRNGRVVGEIKKISEPLDPSDINEYLSKLIISLISNSNPSGTILLSHEFTDKENVEAIISKRTGIKTVIEYPNKGWKKDVLRTALKDCEEMRRVQSLKRRTDLEFRSLSLEQLMNHIKLEKIPYRIESYDISNIGPANRVGSMVVMEDGIPKPSMYRIFHIKSFKGQDDFKSMEEILYRRIRRLTTQEPEKDMSFKKSPDLIVIDGGKGQLSSASKVLAHFEIDVPIIGLAKRNEEIFLVNKDKPLILPHDSEALFVLTTIRDEAHRFAVKEHRRLRLKSINQNDLLSIQGIGEKTVSDLFKEFGSLSKISKASYDELLVMLRPSIAQKVYEFFNGKY